MKVNGALVTSNLHEAASALLCAVLPVNGINLFDGIQVAALRVRLDCLRKANSYARACGPRPRRGLIPEPTSDRMCLRSKHPRPSVPTWRCTGCQCGVRRAPGEAEDAADATQQALRLDPG